MAEPPGHTARPRSAGKSPSQSPSASPKVVAANSHGRLSFPKDLALDPAATPVADAPAPLATSKEDVKRARKVRFNPYVHGVRLPRDEAEDAWAARKSFIREAPYHDELWDGDEDAFREKELTPDELWSIKFKSKVSSLPRKLRNPLKRGFRALKSFLPSSQTTGVDQVSAHARKYKEEELKETSPTMLGTIKRQSSASLRTLELYAEEVTPATFKRFDELTKLMESLSSVPGDLAAAEELLARHRKELLQAKDELRKLRFEVPELERRLAKNANPRLLHYVQIARDDKVRKLQHDFDVHKAKKEHEQKRVETLAMCIYQENERVDKLGEKLARLRGAEAERDALKRFVVQECGKEDPAMVRLWEACDDRLGRLEKEKTCEKRLRRAAERLRTFVLADRLETARKSVIEALELSKTVAQHRPRNSLGGFRASGVRATSSAPQFVRYLTLTGSSLSATPQQQSSPLSQHSSLDGKAGGSPSHSSQGSAAILQRRVALERAREAIAQAVEDLEVALDDLEQHVPAMWTPATREWRKEVPDLNLPEFFGAGTLTKKSDGHFDVIRKSSSTATLVTAGEDPAGDAQAEVRCSKKLGVINKVTELAKRYAEFVEREATRTYMRVAQLSDQKKELDMERAKKEQLIFDSAQVRSQCSGARAAMNLGGGEGSPAATELSSPMSVSSRHPINKVRSTTAASISSSATSQGGDEADETSSMIFPSGVESPRSVDSRPAF